MSDLQVAIFAVVCVFTYWLMFRIVTGKQGYVWISRKQYDQTMVNIAIVVKQNEEYKKLLAQPTHFPTVAKEQKLFDVKTVKPANGQRYTVTLKDGTYSLPYTDFANWNKGLVKVERTLYQRDNIRADWSKKPHSVKTIWINEEDLATKESYSKDKLQCWLDKEIDLDWRKEETAVPQYNASQIELINY